MTNSSRKLYSCIVLSFITTNAFPTPKISFPNAKLEDVSPHKDGPIVLTIIVMGHNVHRVLINQGSLVNIVF